MPISVIVGIMPTAGLISNSKSSLSNQAQLTSHLESKGVHPHIGDLAATQERLHLLIENILLSEQSL